MAENSAESGVPKRILMTAPHDGHPDTEVCPACPHETRGGEA